MSAEESNNQSNEYLELEGQRLFWDYELSRPAIFLRTSGQIIKYFIRAALLVIGVYGLYVVINHLWLLSQADHQIFTAKSWLPAELKYFWWGVLAWCYLFFSFNLESSTGNNVIKKTYADQSNKPVRQKNHHLNIAKSFAKQTLKLINRAYLKALAEKQALSSYYLLQELLADNKVRGILVRLCLPTGELVRIVRERIATIPPVNNFNNSEAMIKTLMQAYLSARQNNHQQVTTLDLLAAVVAAEKNIQEIFFEFKVTDETLANALKWANINQQLLDSYERHKTLSLFKPKGTMDRAMTALATPYLDSISDDLTLLSRAGYLPLCVAREKEIQEIFNIIQGGRNSVVLVGLSGVGKTNIMEGIANLMVEEEVPPEMNDKRLVSLSIPKLIAGAASAGELEERIMTALTEVVRAGNIILHLDDIHNLVGLTSAGGNIDVAKILTDFLSKKSCLLIATTTPNDFAKSLAASPLGQILEKVIIDEPDDNRAIQMVEAKAGFIEGKHQVFFTYEALERAVKLSRRYLPDAQLPDKAIRILEEVAMTVQQQKGKNQLITGEDVAATISHKTNIPLTEVTHDESANLLHLEERIHQRMVNQEEAVSLVASALRRARAELRDAKRPIVNLLFLGPTGVGKTELAKTVAQVYFGSEDRMIRLDMSEYQNKESLLRLIGGKDEAGLLTEAVRNNPFSLVLLDEIEKGHADILNLFLQVMDDGRLTDGLGRTVDFGNTIIIATSNAAANFIQDSVRAGKTMEEIKNQLLLQELRQYFKPEFLNRFDGIVTFKPLSVEHIEQIAVLLLAKVKKRLEQKGIYLEVAPEAVKELARAGFDPVFGARPLRRVIQDRVDNALANYLLTGKITRRDKVILEKGGGLRIEKAEKF